MKLKKRWYYELPELIQQKVNELNNYFQYCRFDGTSSLAPTRESYKTYSVISDDIDSLIEDFNEILDELIRDGGYNLTIYWRMRPQLYGENGGYKIRCRLLISEAPVDAEFVQGKFIER